MENRNRYKVFILDDHPMVMNGIEKILSSYPTFKLIGTCITPDQAVPQVLNSQPDILIFDYQMPGITGLEIFIRLRSELPALKGICYTQHSEAWIMQQIIKAKINGLVLKSEDPSMLMSSLHAVSQGEEFYSPLVNQIVCNTFIQSQNFNLTKREIEVLRNIAIGLSSKEIAERMNLSTNTIEDYRKNLMAKLLVKNATGLVHKATKMGLI